MNTIRKLIGDTDTHPIRSIFRGIAMTVTGLAVMAVSSDAMRDVTVTVMEGFPYVAAIILYTPVWLAANAVTLLGITVASVAGIALAERYR